MSRICRQLQPRQNPESLLSMRKKPAEIVNFMVDLRQFEGQLGSLRKVPTINRSQFRLLNDAECLVDAHLQRLHEEVVQAQAVEVELLQ
jgi:hypothetical protein